jgi:phosphoribosylglycinamide formyltransferase-1
VFVSGSGTNLQAVIEATATGALPLDLRLVLSDNPDAFALERAARAGIPSLVEVWHRDRETRAQYGARIAEAVRQSGARLVLLLGWMHVLSKVFLEAGFEGILNLHPAYLPDDPSSDEVTLPDGTISPVFRGAHALRDALAAGVPVTGASLIEITHEVDRGRVFARKTFALRSDDDEARALARLHETERDVVQEGVLTWVERHAKTRTR